MKFLSCRTEAEHLDALPSYDCRSELPTPCCEYTYDSNIFHVDHVLLFYKYYDPTRGVLMYMGHIIVPVTIKFGKSSHFVLNVENLSYVCTFLCHS